MALCRRIEIYPLDCGYLIEFQRADEKGNFEPTRHVATNDIPTALEEIKTYLTALKSQDKLRTIAEYQQDILT